MTVKRTVTEVYEEDIPFGTEEVVDANYAKGYQAVRSSGVLGKRLVTADVVYVNGLETDRTEIDSTVLKEPVDQVVTVGTAEPIQVLSSSSGSGYSSSSGGFIWPVDGGYLSCGINGYWGHTGMDIAASRGTVIPGGGFWERSSRRCVSTTLMAFMSRSATAMGFILCMPI